jgi:hypothetical protein
MPSQHVTELCSSSDTVTKTLAENPTQEVSKIASKLFKKSSVISQLGSRFTTTKQYGGTDAEEKERLDKAAECAKFPYRPSDLFLKVSRPGLGQSSAGLNFE